MCCSLDQLSGRLIVQMVGFEKNEENEEKILHLRGIYDRSPKTWADRFSRFFPRLELLEKISEVVDEFFHLCGPLFQQYTNLMVYQTLRHLHHAAHDVEHVLHSFCFLGDLTRILTGKFFEYHDQERTQLDYVRSLARICHAVAHFFATAEFLHELKLCRLDKFEKAFKYTAVFSLVGYAIWTTSLVWQRYQGGANDQFASDMCIHLGGCLFEAIPLTKTMNSFAPYTSFLNKAASLAGIIHAWFVVQRLMPQDREEVVAEFIIPDFEEDDFPQSHHHSPGHEHLHSHSHRHHVKFYPVY